MSEQSLKYNQPISKNELKEYSELDLKDKVQLSSEIIKEFYENVDRSNGEKIFIASSFGKDSIVLIDLVRKIYPHIEIIYINTGVDQPSNVELSKKYDNVITLTPKKSMKEVIDEYGYIIPLGKDKSSTIEQVRRNLYDGKFNTWRVRKMRGDLGEGSMYNYQKYLIHLLAPFKISDRCCYWLKTQPMDSFTKKNNYKYQFNGQTAEESLMRKNSILKKGFNIMDSQSKPLAHWRVHDILEYIVAENLELSGCYGDIILENGEYKTTQFYRTGCTCCPVGSHLDSPNQFQLLYEYDKPTWDYVINELGFKQVLEWFEIPYKNIDEGDVSQSKLI